MSSSSSSSSSTEEKAPRRRGVQAPMLFRLAHGEEMKQGSRVVAIQSKKDRENQAPEVVVGTILHLGAPLPDDAPDLDDIKQEDLAKMIRQLRGDSSFDISQLAPTDSTRCHYMFTWKKKSNFLRRVGGGTAGILIGRPFGKELPSLLERMNRDAGKPIHPNDEGVFAKAGLDPVTQTTRDYDASKVPAAKPKKNRARASDDDEKPKAKKNNKDKDGEEDEKPKRKKAKKEKKREEEEEEEGQGEPGAAEEKKNRKKSKMSELIAQGHAEWDVLLDLLKKVVQVAKKFDDMMDLQKETAASKKRKREASD